MILIMISAVYVRVFLSKLKKNFNVFRDYMISAKMTLNPIDIQALDYDDFADLAEVTNSMTQRINQLLHYDELTGLYNRRRFKEVFDTHFDLSPDKIGLIVIDIDFFKHVNDTYGHDIGDETLVIVSRLLEEKTPDDGTVGRFGGEEFIILLPDTSMEETIAVAESIRLHIEKRHIDAINGHLTISGGVAYSGQWHKESLFKQADKKLYEAKKLGRNRIVY